VSFTKVPSIDLRFTPPSFSFIPLLPILYV
jgi:hypothetical protein